MRIRTGRVIPTTLLLGLLSVAVALAQTGPLAKDGSVRAGTGKPPVRPARRPETYGTSYISYYVVDAAEFSVIDTVFTYSGINNFNLRYSTNSNGFVFIAPVHLPAGAQIVYMEVDYYDSTPSGQAIATLEVCDYAGQSCSNQPGSCGGTATVCSDLAGADGYGFATADLSSNGIFVNNFGGRYEITSGNTTVDGSTAISQIIIGYVLQVSPAPGTASFNDVPTGHPFFQFIEALYASGITGGCGSGNYCPDAPLTRGQMAVFLAKALGLQFH